MFLSEDGLEVVRVDCGVASIPFFWIDILLSSKSVWFGAKMTKVESDDKVELGEVLGPLCLPLGQYLGSRKILKVLMIHNNVDGVGSLSNCQRSLTKGHIIDSNIKSHGIFPSFSPLDPEFSPGH